MFGHLFTYLKLGEIIFKHNVNKINVLHAGEIKCMLTTYIPFYGSTGVLIEAQSRLSVFWATVFTLPGWRKLGQSVKKKKRKKEKKLITAFFSQTQSHMAVVEPGEVFTVGEGAHFRV